MTTKALNSLNFATPFITSKPERARDEGDP